MPLNTDVTPAAPQVIVGVFDDSGGGPTPHVVDVHVSWDPAFMRYLGASPAAKYLYKAGSGTARWHKTRVVAAKMNKKKFIVRLQRKKPGDTWVIASTHEPSTGQKRIRKYKVGVNFP